VDLLALHHSQLKSWFYMSGKCVSVVQILKKSSLILITVYIVVQFLKTALHSITINNKQIHMQDELLERFLLRIADLGLAVDHIDDDGQIHIAVGEGSIKVSLDNVRKSHERDGDFSHLDSLIESIHEYLIETPIPDWQNCKGNVYLSLFPSDHDFTDFIHEPVTPEFDKYYVLKNGDQYIWMNTPQLKQWGIDEQILKAQIAFNMASLLQESAIETVVLDDGTTLAYFDTPMVELKAAMLFSDNLKEKILPILGWPVYCVLPVRDFCYLFSEADMEALVESLAGTVVKEYNESGYEITTEILKISDEGIEAIGKYAAAQPEGG
jgi:hypothetical protein